MSLDTKLLLLYGILSTRARKQLFEDKSFPQLVQSRRSNLCHINTNNFFRQIKARNKIISKYIVELKSRKIKGFGQQSRRLIKMVAFRLILRTAEDFFVDAYELPTGINTKKVEMSSVIFILWYAD